MKRVNDTPLIANTQSSCHVSAGEQKKGRFCLQMTSYGFRAFWEIILQEKEFPIKKELCTLIHCIKPVIAPGTTANVQHCSATFNGFFSPSRGEIFFFQQFQEALASVKNLAQMMLKTPRSYGPLCHKDTVHFFLAIQGHDGIGYCHHKASPKGQEGSKGSWVFRSDCHQGNSSSLRRSIRPRA